MNPNYTNPDDPESARTEPPIEQRLKQLRPRPIQLDTDSIVRAALQAQPTASTCDTVVTPAAEPQKRRDGKWMTIGTAFLCGTVAGVLLTCLVISRTSGGGTRASADANGDTSTDLAGGVGVTADHEVAVDISQERLRATGTPATTLAVPSTWSRSEWWVSNQWIETNPAFPNGERPLMAGNYALQNTALQNTAPQNTVAISPKNWRPTEPSSQAATELERTKPTRTMDRARLLDELSAMDADPLL